MWTSKTHISPSGEDGFAQLAAAWSQSGEILDLGETAPKLAGLAKRLCEWGGAVLENNRARLLPPWSSQLLALFAPLLDAFQPTVLDTPLPGCPVSLKAGLADLPAIDREGGEGKPVKLVAGGQGVEGGFALISCLGELAERLSLFSLGPDDRRIRTGVDAERSIALGPLLGFSPAQEHQLAGAYPAIAEHFNGGRIDWNSLDNRCVELLDLSSNKRVMAPAFGVLMGEGAGLGLAGLSLSSTLGSAVWADSDEALRRALLELVERDAVGQFWYNRLGITRLSRPDMPHFIHRNCHRYLEERERETHFFAVDTDLKAHVVIAVSYERSGLGGCFGAAAGRSLSEACSSAVEEMLQGEQSLGLMARAYSKETQPARLPSALLYASTVRIAEDLHLDRALAADTAGFDIVHEPDALLASCLDRSIQLLAFDATRPDIGVPCMKLLSPQLCSWQPRFGKQRLFEGVVKRGWAEAIGSEDEFSERSFPF